MVDPTPDALAAGYDDPHRKAERIVVDDDRFERTVAGGDGGWGVGGLVFDAGRTLFVREGETWLLPGGRLEGDESPEAGAIREIREETGIDVRITGLGAIAEQTLVHEETGETGVLYFATFHAEPAAPGFGTSSGATAGGAVSGTKEEPPREPPAERPTPKPTARRIDEAAWLSDVPETTFDRDLVVRLLDERA